MPITPETPRVYTSRHRAAKPTYRQGYRDGRNGYTFRFFGDRHSLAARAYGNGWQAGWNKRKQVAAP